MNFTKILFFFSFVLTIHSFVGQDFSANNQLLKFKQFSLTEGLSQSSVLCILQDSKGYMWFGTRDGLNKYDGHNFKTYRYNYRDKKSISNSFIRSLIEDKNGDIWIGTNNGLNKYIPHEDNFETFKNTNDSENLIDNEIWSLAIAKGNYLWIGTNAGLKKFSIDTAKSENIISDSKSYKTALRNQIRSIFVASDNNLWICNRENIALFSVSKNEFKLFSYPETQVRKSTRNYIPVIYEDKNADIWLGYRDGLAIFNVKKNEFEHFNLASENISSINSEVRTIHQDLFGNIWVGTYDGLYIINKEKSLITQYVHDENNLNSISQNSIYSIIGDTKGDVWIGTYAGGINYYDRSFDLFKNYYAGANDQKLNYKVISSIIENKAGNLWIGTEGGGLNFLDKKTGKFTYYIHNVNNSNSISTNNVKSLIETKEGNLWIGTHDGGLNFLNPRKKPYVFKKYKQNIKDSLSLSNDRIIALLEDYNKNIWIGTSGAGLNMLDVKSNTFLRIKEANSFVGDFVFNISKTNNKDVLLISGSKGLAKINVDTKKWTLIKYKNKQEEAENTTITLCTFEDASKNIWIGTQGDGLYYYNLKTRKSIRFGAEEGLPNQVIYTILPDNYNNLWFSTNKGLSRLNLETRQFKNFDVSDGLISNEFNYNSKIELKSKELMFGSTNGLVFFNPDKITENAFIPPVYITSITVNNKPFLSGTIIDKEITLTHNQNVFGFYFIALSYSQSDKNKYAYKLEGFDKDWNYIGNTKSATYTNLDAGNYVFKVKAANSDGLWNEKGQSINVQIKPPFWKTWWAYLTYILLFIGALFLIRKYSLLRIHEKNELKQERLEKEKIEEINNLKLRMFTDISHDFRTPLTLIIGPLERMIQENQGTEFIKKQHNVMYRNAKTLLTLINQLLDFRTSESGNMQLRASKNNIVPFIENIKLSFDELASFRNIVYSLEYSKPSLEIWFDKITINKVIYNLLSNSFKFTPKEGNISIKISTTESEKRKGKFLKIDIIDNGIGIPKRKIKYIFNRFYQIGKDDKVHSGSGIGLALTKNLIELHKGEIKVKSSEGKGTQFTLLLPFGKNHLTKNQMINLDKNAINEEKQVPNLLPFEKELNEEQKIFSSEKQTILIVDDNAEIRTFIKNIFTEKMNILEAENGEVALEIAINNEIDIILSDLMMPKMDGIELCKQIKTSILTSHIPVILLTAKTSVESQKTGFTTGADAYINKPFDASVLQIRVNSLLKNKEILAVKYKQDILLQPKMPKIDSVDEIFLNKAVKLIEENITNADFTIENLTEEMGMSRSSFYRKIKALTGQSINQFVRIIKLKRAAQLLKNSDLNVSEIAYDLGFNDLKYFRKFFKKMFKELPSAYRNSESKV